MITGSIATCNRDLAVDDKKYSEGLAERIEVGLDECKRRGLSRSQIAKRMGYADASVLSKWISEQTPEAKNLRKLALATGLSLDWLVAERGPMFPPGGTDAVRLQVIGKIADGKLDAVALKKIAELDDEPTNPPARPPSAGPTAKGASRHASDGETREGGSGN